MSIECVPNVSTTDTQIVLPLREIITEGIPPILNTTAWATGEYVGYIILSFDREVPLVFVNRVTDISLSFLV